MMIMMMTRVTQEGCKSTVEDVEHDDDYHIDQHHGDGNDKNDHNVLMMIIVMMTVMKIVTMTRATQEGCKSAVNDHEYDRGMIMLKMIIVCL